MGRIVCTNKKRQEDQLLDSRISRTSRKYKKSKTIEKTTKSEIIADEYHFGSLMDDDDVHPESAEVNSIIEELIELLPDGNDEHRDVQSSRINAIVNK